MNPLTHPHLPCALTLPTSQLVGLFPLFIGVPVPADLEEKHSETVRELVDLLEGGATVAPDSQETTPYYQLQRLVRDCGAAYQRPRTSRSGPVPTDLRHCIVEVHVKV